MADGNTILANLPVNATVGSGLLGYYSGDVLQQSGGDNSKFNINCFPAALNADVDAEQPADSSLLPSCGCTHPFNTGDNPATKYVEGRYYLCGTNSFDNPQWSQVAFKLPINMWNGAYFPEQAATAPTPTSPTLEEIHRNVMSHEFAHVSNYGSSGIDGVPTEAMATSVECDTAISGGVALGFRASSWSQMHTAITRAGFTPMSADGLVGQTFSTYGSSYFWTYLAEQFDYNRQIIRRVNDIMGSKAITDLYKANNFANRIITTPTGGSMALNQALGELYGKNIKDIWNNFCVSLVLLRNNTSIPAQYRTQYPFWIYSTQYVGNPIILAALTSLGQPQFSNWWDMVSNDGIIPANWNGGALPPSSIGQTVIRTLPSTFTQSVPDLTNLSFSVPSGTNTVTVNISAGEWRISVFQFTSDTTPVGTFIMDGPYTITGAGSHVFNIAAHSPAFTPSGKIRLVCTHVSLTDLGGINNYLGTQTNTGTISIIKT